MSTGLDNLKIYKIRRIYQLIQNFVQKNKKLNYI